MWEVYLEWWQAYVLLVDCGLARYGEGSTELSRGKVEICGRCVTSFVLIKTSQSVFSVKVVMSLTRVIG